jgi:hypothetical protein
MFMMSDRIAKLEPREKPEAAQIIQEIRDAVNTAQQLGVFEKIELAHMTRRCLWANQSADGMRHGLDVFPWDNSLDSKVPLADEIVTDHVRLRMSAIRNGTVQIGPENEIEDSGKARQWNDVLKYYRGRTRRAMKAAQKLFCTCVEEIGYGILQVDWRAEKVLKPQEMTRARVVSAVAQRMMVENAGPDGSAPGPELQQAIAEESARLVEERLGMGGAGAVELILLADGTMPKSEAVKVVNGLKKGQEVVTYYAPKTAGGMPVVKARIPWVDCGHAVDLGPDGKCSWWFALEWLDEVGLRMRCEQEGCSDAWRDAVLTQGNKGLSELLAPGAMLPTWLLNGVGVGFKFDTQTNQRAPMYQVLTVWRLAVNEAGIPAVYQTMVHAHVGDMLGKHECCEVGELPFVAEAREPAAMMMQSRGIPEMVLTDQVFLKKGTDATMAMAELAAFPPYERAMGDGSRIAPGAELPVKRNTGTSGTQSRFLQVPGVDAGALRAMEMTRENVNRFFMRAVNSDADAKRLFQEDLAESAVLSFEELIRIIWLHVQAYVDEVTASRIAGRPVSVAATAEDLEGTADVTVEFSAMALNQKTALELADYMTTMAGLDRSGRIDFGKVVELITRIFDPVLSENIIMPGEEASGEIEKDEQAVIAAILSGQYVTGRVNGASLRWQVLQRWLGNPQTVPMLQGNPMIYASLMEHVKGLQQEIVQKQQNVFTGQTGQKPEAPWEEGGKPVGMVEAMVEGGGTPR